FIGKESGGDYALIDPVTGQPAGAEPRGGFDKIKVNNALRRTLEATLGSLTLLNPNPDIRRTAADSLFHRPDASAIATLDGALAKETDASVKQLMEQARAAALLRSDRPVPEKIDAVKTLTSR